MMKRSSSKIEDEYKKVYLATKFEKDAERRQEDSQKNLNESGCTHFSSSRNF